MKKECNVVMLPTEKAVEDGQLFLDEGIVKIYSGDRNRVFTGQHLYITSDDEIKEGDWCIHGDKVAKYVQKAGGSTPWFKIIASTDPELTKCEECKLVKKIRDNHTYNCSCSCTDAFIPQIAESFIKEYVKNPVDKVMVEYTQNGGWSNDEYGYKATWKSKLILKLDNNQIIISPVEEKMYSRDEVNVLFNRFTEFIAHNEPQEWNKWIKENL